MERYIQGMKTRILTRNDVESLITMKEVLPVIEDVFNYFGQGKTLMPPKLYINLPKYNGDFRAMPAYVDDIKKCALKWVNVHPDNPQSQLPSVMGLIILSNPQNGFPLCVMDGTYSTMMRTGAAGGIAAQYLARKNASRVGFVGCGKQAYSQLLALREFFTLTQVIVWGHQQSLAMAFLKKINSLNISARISLSIKECVNNADIIVTTTPSRTPLVKKEWIKKGTHINAIGADAAGKQELDPEILLNAKIVVDAWDQAVHSGEINVAFRKNIISRNNIYADIGEIVSGKKIARENDDEISIFDSTGLAIQDVAIANLIYKKAVKQKKGIDISLIS